MRTSGSGPDLLMASIPLSLVLVYLLVSAGGPKQALKVADRGLQSAVEWAIRTAHVVR